jgi:hypothetical protein
LYSSNFFPACSTQKYFGCISYEGLAGKAERGKNYIEQRPEQQNSKPHIFIHHQDPDIGKFGLAINDSGNPADPFGRIAVTTETGLGTWSFVIQASGVGW